MDSEKGASGIATTGFCNTPFSLLKNLFLLLVVLSLKGEKCCDGNSLPLLFHVYLPFKEITSLPALLQFLPQETLAVFSNVTAGKDIRNRHSQCNAKNDQ